MAAELESDLGRKWFLDFNTGKTQLILFDRSNNTSAFDMKMDRYDLEEKSAIKMLRLSFSAKLDWRFDIIFVAETASKKIGALARSMNFLSPEVTFYLNKSSIRPCMEY